MELPDARRVELLLPMRTVLIVLAALGLAVAFAAIGDTFLIVFVGIFLALVFEYPVRFVMAKTRMSRGLAATVTVLGTAVAVVVLMLLLPRPARRLRAGLPPGAADDGRAAARRPTSSPGSATRAPPRTCRAGAQQVSVSMPDAISAVLGIAGSFFGVFLAGFTILFICLFLLSDITNLKRSLASVLMPGEDDRWLDVWERVTTVDLPLGDRRRRHRVDRRHDAGDRPRGSSGRATPSGSASSPGCST